MKKKIVSFSFFIILFIVCKTNSQIQFEQYSVSTTSRSTEGLYICDIEDDGDNDIIGAVADDYDVVWWRNDGGNPVQWVKIIIDGNFIGAGDIFAADLTNDTHIDIIAGAKFGNQVAWWENSGEKNITWTKHIIQSGYIYPHEVFAYDINKDGLMDILAAASSTQDEITWWKNNGGNPVTWTRYIIASNFTQAKSVHAGDINGDGLPDVIGAGLNNNKISWWENDGNNPINWTEHIVTNDFYGAHRVQAIDIDKDNKLDILGTGYYANEISLWRNEGGNPVTWTKQTIATNFMNACIAMAIDIDNDGNLDIVGSAQSGNEVAWWHNEGGNPIVWTKYVIDGNFYRVWPLYAGDLDKDGDVDIVAASGFLGNYRVQWYKNNLIIGIKQISQIVPEKYSLYQNYPNPFNPSTTIKFQIKESGFTSLKVFDNLGKEISELINHKLKEGTYEIQFSVNHCTNNSLASGIYFYQLIANDNIFTRNMIFLK